MVIFGELLKLGTYLTIPSFIFYYLQPVNTVYFFLKNGFMPPLRNQYAAIKARFRDEAPFIAVAKGEFNPRKVPKT